jgi:hypothetical protein
VVLALVVVGVGYVLLSGGPPRAQVAAEECGIEQQHFEVADGGNTIIIDGPAEVGITEAFFTDLECVWDALAMPQHIRTRVGNTSSLSGQQQASWEGLSASWTYHPDNGLDMEIHEEG